MEKVEYEKFVFACEKIANRVKKLDMESIYGIPRGGSVVAVYLSHLTGLPVIEENLINEKTLIVDDIADTGQTLYDFISYTKSKSATIYYHKQSVIEPDIWIFEKKDDWILFPWETEESTT